MGQIIVRGNCAVILPRFLLLLKRLRYRTTLRPDTGVLESCSFLFASSATRGAEFPSDSLAFLNREDEINGGQLDTFFSA